MNALVQALAGRSDPLLAQLESIYKDLHQHPELSMQEVRTARIATDYIEVLGYEVARDVGGTGEGASVMLRADRDALPMAENTGLHAMLTAASAWLCHGPQA